VRDLVLDATVVLPWFDTRRVAATATARRLRVEFEAGAVAVAVPSLLFLEVVNVAGRQWGWAEPTLTDLTIQLEALGFEVAEPTLASVASWVARGLTAYDATYVALAEGRGVPLVTSDRGVLAVARGVARSAEHALEG
jgi:predicted nucleic acid-binding protein